MGPITGPRVAAFIRLLPGSWLYHHGHSGG